MEMLVELTPTPWTFMLSVVPPTDPVAGEIDTSFGVRVKPDSTRLCPWGFPVAKVTLTSVKAALVTFVRVKTT
jgi:hypothetical protein